MNLAEMLPRPYREPRRRDWGKNWGKAHAIPFKNTDTNQHIVEQYEPCFGLLSEAHISVLRYFFVSMAKTHP